MTRENKLPIPRQGSRTCETKNKGGKEGGDVEEENNQTSIMGAWGETALSAGCPLSRPWTA